MPDSEKACTDSVIQVLGTNPGQFEAVARQTNRLPGSPLVRDYSDAEIEQLTSGVVRMLLEAARDEEPKARSVLMEHAIPSLLLAGETVAGLLQWTASYLILFGSALADAVPSERRAGVLAWFSAFSGVYVADVFQAALEASPGSKG